VAIEEHLQEILERGDDGQCLAFFQNLDETQRRKLAPRCLEMYRLVRRNDFIETAPGHFQGNPLLSVVTAAVLATANLSELNKLGWQARPSDDLAYELLCARRPSWLAEWAQLLLDEDVYWARWLLVRKLVVAGLIERPGHPHYYLGMIGGLHGPGGLFDNQSSVEQSLRNDPALLEHEVWQLFEHEGGGENSLANFDRFGRGGSWSEGLLALMRSGDLPRERLLRCSLEALQRDFNHYRAKWFADFHDALQPTRDEQRGFADTYLQLLGVSAPNIVSWTYKKVESLVKDGALSATELIPGLRPVLQARTKGIVLKTLKLLDRVLKKSPQFALEASRMAVTALAHEDAEVQGAVLDLVDKFGNRDDDELKSRIAQCASVVAMSQRERLGRWLESDDVAEPVRPAGHRPDAADHPPLESIGAPLDATLCELFQINALQENLRNGQLKIPAATFDGTDILRLRAVPRLSPIDDLDELIDVCARVVEDGSLVDDAERAFDGVSRLCGDKPGDFQQRVAPLLKRVVQRLKKNMLPFAGIGPDDDICGLVYAWTTGQVLELRPSERGGHSFLSFEIAGTECSFFAQNRLKPIGFLAQRSLAVARRVAAGQAAQLLSAPTHADGWIEPQQFVQRTLKHQSDDPDLTDVCLALLRLAPDGRGAAREQLRDRAQSTSAEWKQAIHYALGDDDAAIGSTAPLWLAAARARSPWSDDERIAAAFPEYVGPDTARAARYEVKFGKDRYGPTMTIQRTPPPTKARDAEFVTAALHTQRARWNALMWELGGFAGRTIGSIRWTASIWPLARDAFLAGAAEEIVDNLDWGEARWQNKSLLEPLLDPGTPLRETGLLLLTAALAAKEPGEHGLATDIAIRAIDDGRLGGDNLGAMMRRLLVSGLIKAGRWQATLTDVARISPVHTAVVFEALQHCLAGDPQKMPRDFAKLLELLRELKLQLEQSLDESPCADFLAKVARGSGKAAATAKTLLKCADTAADATRPMNMAIQKRHQAAARFAPDA
jgi:hypothetical protein